MGNVCLVILVYIKFLVISYDILQVKILLIVLCNCPVSNTPLIFVLEALKNRR